MGASPLGICCSEAERRRLRAFEPLRAEKFNDPATQSYLEAFAKLEAGDPSATAAFCSVVFFQPEDQLTSFHLKQLLNGVTGIGK